MGRTGGTGCLVPVFGRKCHKTEGLGELESVERTPDMDTKGIIRLERKACSRVVSTQRFLLSIVTNETCYQKVSLRYLVKITPQ